MKRDIGKLMNNSRAALQLAMERNPDQRNLLIIRSLSGDDSKTLTMPPKKADQIMGAIDLDLTIKQTQVLNLRFDPTRIRTISEVARVLGISRARVHETLTIIGNKINDELIKH